LDYLFNHKAQDGSTAKEASDMGEIFKSKGVAQDAMGTGRIQDPQVRSLFEKYLGMAEVPEARLKAYANEYNTVLNLLRQHNAVEAWKHLLVMSEYRDIDAGVSWELANRIESVWNADKTKEMIAQNNDQLQHQQEAAVLESDYMSNQVRENDLQFAQQARENGGTGAPRNQSGNTRNPPANNGTNGGSGNQPSGGSSTDLSAALPSVSGVMGRLALTDQYVQSLELKAKIKMNEMKSDKLYEQSKSDFSDYINTLFASGRFTHVLIAADFWRSLFNEGDYPVSMAQQVNAALEMSQDVQNSVDVFNYKIDQGDIASATDRLQEAFLLNQFHPAVLGLSRERKQKVESFTNQLDRMQTMIEARDFTDLEPLIKEMKTVAPDFDSTKPMAIVNAAKLESMLRLGKAKLAAQQGDLKTAMDEFQSAAEAWPNNPDLQTNANLFFNKEDSQNQSLEEFDRLFAENNYRTIFDKQLAFAPAMKDDAKRQDQLKTALEKVKGADIAIEKANTLRENGDVFGAWESVQLAIADYPQDVKLNALKGELSGKGAEFVEAINKAQDAEAKQDIGYSLSWYAVALRYYPASSIASQAVTRLSKQVLEKPSL
jgi:tetratricopeptide (TPR) repeat protein